MVQDIKKHAHTLLRGRAFTVRAGGDWEWGPRPPGIANYDRLLRNQFSHSLREQGKVSSLSGPHTAAKWQCFIQAHCFLLGPHVYLLVFAQEMCYS